MADLVSLEQIQEQQQQLTATVKDLIAQKAQLEDQLENTKATLASNQGAVQYANALIQGIIEGQDDVGATAVSEEITAELIDPDQLTLEQARHLKEADAIKEMEAVEDAEEVQL